MNNIKILMEYKEEIESFREILKHAKADYDYNFPAPTRNKRMSKDYKFLLQIMGELDERK